jgi:hypothetical protein
LVYGLQQRQIELQQRKLCCDDLLIGQKHLLCKGDESAWR